MTNKFTKSGESKISQGSKNVTEFLPEIFKTSTNKKFLQSTLEHLMSSGNTETLNTYWGKISGSNYEYKNDFYNLENTTLRQNYQFAPGFSSDYDDNTINVSYINIINQLTNLGYNTADINTIMSEHGYVLDVPINLDMFVNYTSYFWFQQEILPCIIEPTSSDPIDIDNIVKLNSYTTPILENGKTLTFYNGMRVIFTGNNSSSTSGEYFNNHVYIIEGIGTGKINLIWQKTDKDIIKFPRQVPYTPQFPSEWDVDDWNEYEYDYSTPLNFQKEYVVMDRNTTDKNAWARKNQWISLYAIQETAIYNDMPITKMTTPDFIARRPIIEFKPDIKLYDSGDNLRFIIDHHIDNATPDDVIGTTFYNNNGKIIEGAYLDNLGNIDIPGDIVLFTTEGFYGNVYEVSYNDTIGYTDMQLTLLYNINDFEVGDKFFIHHSNNPDYIANELYWNGSDIIRGQQTLSRSDSPLFDLYDHTGTLLSDYNSSTFYGNSIFKYKTSPSLLTDLELNLSAVTDSTSPNEYIYEFPIFEEKYNKNSINDISYTIESDYFYKNIKTNKLNSIWKPTKTNQRPLVNEVFVIENEEPLVHLIDPISDPSEYIFYVSNGNAYFVDRDSNYSTKEINQTLYFKRNTQYIFQTLNIDDFTIENPFGDFPSNIVETTVNGTVIISIDDNYAYDFLYYVSESNNIRGYIFIEDDKPNYKVKHNGVNLIENVDFTNVNNEITIIKSLEIGDVIEFNYFSDDVARPREVSPLFRHNPDNYNINEAKISYLKQHFIDQLENIPNNNIGIGENNYHRITKEHSFGGTIKQQIYSPKLHSVLSAKPEFEPLSLISEISYDYELFKKIFKRKVLQLWNTSSFDTVDQLVNTALSKINVGKTEDQKYANSDMIYYENPSVYKFSITDDTGIFNLPTTINARGTKLTHMYVWLYEYINGSYKWIPLEKNRDYNIDFNRILLTRPAEINGGVPAELRVHIHEIDSKSYVPPSPVKLGFTNKYDVEIKDNTIQCHDGSIHNMSSDEIFDMTSPNFDVVSAALYDLEIRIVNNVSISENITDLKYFIPRKILGDFDKKILSNFLLTDFYNWKAEFGKSDNILENEYTPEDKFTWNYSSVGDGFSSYKTMYKYIFGTFTPHLTPWEMLGYNKKPDWWSTYYSWTDATKRVALISALKDGRINSPEESIAKIEPKYAIIDYRWDSNTLVTTSGVLNDPVSANIVTEPSISERIKPFSFGDLMYEDEIEWYNSSDYIFSMLKALMKIKPYKIHETYWKTGDIINIETLPFRYEVFNDYKTRTKKRTNNIHLYTPQLNEVIDVQIINDGIDYNSSDLNIQAPLNSKLGQAKFEFDIINDSIKFVKITDSGFGYQSNFDLISNTTSDTAILRATVSPCIPRSVAGLNAIVVELYNNEYGDLEKILSSSKTNPILHLGGYSKKDLISLYIDNSYRKNNIPIPKEDYELIINENPLTKRVYYSGIKFEKGSDGYITIDGYNPHDKKFYIYPVNVFGKNINVPINNNYSVNKYLNHSNIIQEVPYKTKFKKKQELYNFLLGLNEYYKKEGFENIDWESSAIGVILWSLLDNTDGTEFFENGIIQNKLIYNQGNFGIIKEIKENKQYRNYAVDINSSLIEPNKLIILRNENNTEILSKSSQYDIYGIELSVVSYEHIIKIKNQTIFGDIIYDTTFGIDRDRIKVIGERTRNWNGKISANGFIVRNNDIIKNFDSNVREIENDILSSRNKSIDTLSRKTDKFTVGYQEKSYFMQIENNSFTTYEFDRGNRKYKGTRLSVDSFMNNNNIFRSSNTYDISEEWMINTTAFGDYSFYEPIQFEIPPSAVSSNPQIIRFGKNNIEDQYDNILDIVENDNNYISGDFDNLLPILPIKNTTLNTKDQAFQFGDHLKTAGMPLIDEVDFTVSNLSDMESVYDVNADYANIPEWSSQISYNQGDVVRVNEKVYQLTAAATGFNFSPQLTTIRGNVTFPVTPSGTTFIFSAADSEDDDLQDYTITFSNSSTSTIFNEIEVIGTVSEPTLDDGDFIQIDNIVINFDKEPEAISYSDIVVTGTEVDPTLPGEQGDILSIDGINVDMSNIQTQTFNFFAVDVMKSTIEVGNMTPINAEFYAGERLDFFNSLAGYMSDLSVNPSDLWGIFISGYFGDFNSIHKNFGLNIEYLKTELGLLDGSQNYYQVLSEFIEHEIELVNQIRGTTYTLTTDFSIDPALTDLTETLNLIGNPAYLPTIINKINQNDISSLYSTSLYQTVETVASPLSVQTISTRITSAMISAGKPNVSAIVTNNKLQIIKKVDDENTVLVIGSTELNDLIGFEIENTTYNTTVSTTITPFTLFEIVNVINSANISGVTAEIEVSGTNRLLKLNSSNRFLQIGVSGNASDLGLTSGIYEADSTQEIIEADVELFDIVSQINESNIQGITAISVNNAVVLQINKERFSIENGTANEFLGFQSGEFISSTVISNVFDENEWTQIPDPINFSIWVQNNLDSFSSNITRESGYNVYRVFDLEFYIEEICAGEFEGDDALVKLQKSHNYDAGDFIVITGSKCTPNIDGIHKITSIIDETSFLIEEYIEEKGFGGKALSLLPTKFNTTDELLRSVDNPKYYLNGLGWKSEMYAYVTSHKNTNIPAVYKCAFDSFNGNIFFNLFRLRENNIDNSKIKNAVVYNYKTGEITKQLEVFDPIKGIIPGIVDKEIDIKSFYDSAIYTNSTDINENVNFSDYWSEEREGTVWWDLSNAVYLDYEQSTLEYKQENWGKLYPTSSIDIYEWTKSPVLPDEYEDAVQSGTIIDGIPLTGTPYFVTDEYDNINYYWTEETKFNKQKSITETYYYFWVKNKTTVPSSNRNYSITILENIIQNPSQYDIIWIAGVNRDSFLISNIEACVQCENSVLQINFDKETTLTHKEYLLLSENSNDTFIPDNLHISLMDSISQIHTHKYILSYTEWNSDFNYKSGHVVKYDDKFFIAIGPNKNILPQSPNEINGFKLYNSKWYEITDYKIINNSKWNAKKYGYVWDGNNWDSTIWDKSFDITLSNTDGDIEFYSELKIPNYNIHPVVRYNTHTSSGKSMFSNINGARRTFVKKVNELLKKINLEISFKDWKNVIEKDFIIDNYSYNLSDYYIYSDWISDDYNKSKIVNYTVDDYSQLATLSPITGDYAKIIDFYSDNRPKTRIYMYDGSSWILIYHQNSTIQFVDELWNYNEYISGWDNTYWDVEKFDNDNGIYIRKITDICRNYLFKDEYNYMYNNLWFTMLEYIHSEQNFVDWAIKSTYIKMIIEKTLTQDKMFKINNFDSLIEFINSNKPFKTKLREMVDKNKAMDNASMSVTSEHLIQITRNTSGSTEDENTLNYIISTNNYNTIDNTLITALEEDVSDTDTTIQVVDGLTMDFAPKPYGTLWINGEKIKYESVSDNYLINCERGFENTSAKSHNAGSIIFNNSFEEETYEDASFRYIL